jgi:hypothetical protein
MKNNILITLISISTVFKMMNSRFFFTKKKPFLNGELYKPLSVLGALLFTVNCSAQFFPTPTYGGVEADAIISIDGDENRNLYITGTFRQQMAFGQNTVLSNGDDDVYVAHLDSTGLPIWIKTFGSISNDEASDVAYKNGFIYATGFFWDSIAVDTTTLKAGFGGSALYIVKLNAANGNLIWSKVIEGNGIKEITDLEIDQDLSIYISGHYSQTIKLDNITYQPNGTIAGFIIKYDANGVEQWSKNLGITASTYANHVLADSNFVYLVGNFNGQIAIGDSTFISAANDNNGFLAKWTATGQFQWAEEMIGVGDLNIADIERIGDKLIIGGHYQNSLRLGGNLMQSPTIDYNVFIAKYFKNGDFIDVLNLGNSNNEFLTGMDVMNDLILIGGYFFGDNHFNGSTGSLVFHGNPLVAASYGYLTDVNFQGGEATYQYSTAQGFNDVLATDVHLTVPTNFSDYNYSPYKMVVGNFENAITTFYDPISVSNGSFDFFIAYLPMYVLTNAKDVIENRALEIFPNPTSAELNIRTPFEKGEIRIYNSIGQEVLSEKITGKEQNIQLSHLESGIYFLSVQSGKEMITKRFVKNFR